MPGLILALTIISGLSFATATGWVILQWSRADREVSAQESLDRRLHAVGDRAA